jgi:hypothetical protein
VKVISLSRALPGTYSITQVIDSAIARYIVDRDNVAGTGLTDAETAPTAVSSPPSDLQVTAGRLRLSRKAPSSC